MQLHPLNPGFPSVSNCWQGILCAILLVFATSALAELERVDNPTGAGSLAPTLTRLPDGSGVILAWLEKEADQHVFRFSTFRNGRFSEVREIARGRNWFANWADTPGVHVRTDGTWLAHWLEKSADSTYAYDIRLAHSANGGTDWGDPRTPHTDGTPTEHGFVSYFPAGGNRTGMVWLDGRQTIAGDDGLHDHAGYMTLRTAVIAADGSIGPETLIDERVCDCCQTASALSALGPLVAYRNRTEDEIRDIALVRRTDQGWTEPRLVHADGWKIGGCPVNGPSMIADDLKVILAWFTMADGNPRVRFAISDDAGANFGAPTTLSPGTAIGRLQLAWVTGGFVLGWMEESDHGARMRLARYSSEGELLDDRVVTRVDSGRISGFPRIVSIGEKILVAWTATVGDADEGKRTRIMTGIEDLSK